MPTPNTHQTLTCCLFSLRDFFRSTSRVAQGKLLDREPRGQASSHVHAVAAQAPTPKAMNPAMMNPEMMKMAQDMMSKMSPEDMQKMQAMQQQMCAPP